MIQFTLWVFFFFMRTDSKELVFVCRRMSSSFVGCSLITNSVQLLAMDVLVSVSMKNAARCATWCELQNSVNHQLFERTWHRGRFSDWLLGLSLSEANKYSYCQRPTGPDNGLLWSCAFRHYLSKVLWRCLSVICCKNKTNSHLKDRGF